MKNKNTFVTLIIPIVAAIAGILAFQLLSQSKVEKDQRAQFIKGGPFALSNEGEKFELSQLAGAPSIIYFGFTHCPDICPIGLTVIRDAFNSSDKFNDTKALFITLDPERDTKSKLEEYTSFFHENIIGLTGEMDEIQAVAKKYATYFKKVPMPESELKYTVDHTAYFFLLDANGELMRVLDHNTKADKLAEEFSKLI